MKNKIFKILEICLIIFGVCTILYPFTGRLFAKRQQLQAVQSYENNSNLLDSSFVEEQRKMAKKYDDNLLGLNIEDPFASGSGTMILNNYDNILNISDGIMGSIKIPKIDVNIPIYHGVSDEVLQLGAGHIKETAFPIGGKGNHSVLCAHRGVPTSKLFTDLNKLQEGDKFYIDILNERHTYIVDKISVVEPGDTKYLRPVEGKDYITLLTCTPYGINSHRLLVRGVRGEDVKLNKDNKVYQNVTEQIVGGSPLNIIYIVVILIVVIVLFIFIIKKFRKR